MTELKIFYNNKKITENEFLTPSETKEEPIIKYNSNNDELYTLILYDPDSIYGTYIHWSTVNIPGDNISKGSIVIPYIGPHPPSGSGIHNYTFQLYKQTEKKDINPIGDREISIEDLKNKLQVSNLVSQFIFKSQYETGGRNQKSKMKKPKNKKSKKRTKRRNKKTKQHLIF